MALPRKYAILDELVLGWGRHSVLRFVQHHPSLDIVSNHRIYCAANIG